MENKNITRIKKIPEFFHVLLFCRMNAMTATGTRERIHGKPDFCVVEGIGGTTVCSVSDWGCNNQRGGCYRGECFIR